MVRLTRIYTRTGDGGQTRLVDFSETAKTDLRVAAYGDVDEANSAIGVALAGGDLPARAVEVLGLIQNELFDVGADLANPVPPPGATLGPGQHHPLRITQESVDRLEAWCDEFAAASPKLESFVLPGGKLGAAYLHVARTVTRRAERTGWAARESEGERLNPLPLTYLNRLSDLLFILTRYINGAEHEVLWVPGSGRPRPTESDHDQPNPQDQE
ncbi:cob(I)yrinic acid a,c-diamide adenosyltransferase [Microlunatus speluncae]|uniref:cob(I)yrinic acid a,c-diamide adenosyltransferase n=1 Tax=Microlunatus speluncae TaxID=2594267 RepID=UPI001266123D|nr:cob(I)yrinic acid a,c-diamide adenosyltransferase [Microlunatus speluncae]